MAPQFCRTEPNRVQIWPWQALYHAAIHRSHARVGLGLPRRNLVYGCEYWEFDAHYNTVRQTHTHAALLPASASLLSSWRFFCESSYFSFNSPSSSSIIAAGLDWLIDWLTDWRTVSSASDTLRLSVCLSVCFSIACVTRQTDRRVWRDVSMIWCQLRRVKTLSLNWVS